MSLPKVLVQKQLSFFFTRLEDERLGKLNYKIFLFWTMTIHNKFNENSLKLSQTNRHTDQPCLPSLSRTASRTNTSTKALAKIPQMH